MPDAALALPESVEVVRGPHGPRFRGPSRAVAEAAEGLRGLSDKPTGYRVRLGVWTLAVDEDVPRKADPLVVTMPGRAWNIAASVLRDAANGDYESPFDFGDVGYLEPRPDPDIGVEVVAEPTR